MSTVLVTGATGALGRQVLEFLLERVPASNIAASARHPDQLSDLTARGVSVRPGDYHDATSLTAAFRGVDKLLLVSAPAFSDAVTGHHNVITAAAEAGVSHLYFTAIQRRNGSDFEIPQVTAWNRDAEEELARSGMAVTILRNTLYVEALDHLIGEPDAEGVIRVPAGHTAAAVATRRDLAAATANVLAGDGHADRDYTLSGSTPITLDDIATTIGRAQGRVVTYQDVPADTWVSEAVDGGTPEPGARFQASWFRAIAAGEFSDTGDLQRLLGRPPEDPLEAIRRRRVTPAAALD